MTHAVRSPYVVTSSSIVSEIEHPYVLTINDIPCAERPRERLLAEGPSALSTTELMAIVLSVGTRKENVLSMAERITSEYGDRSIMQETDAKRLAEEASIPLGKSMQIVASAELGRRFFAKNDRQLPIVRTASEVFEHTADMRNLPKEHLRGLYLNSRYKVIRDEVLSMGTIDTNLVHPREVFRPALEYAAAAVILVHNHPSGELIPSSADLMVTEQLIEAGRLLGIELVDHVIVSKEGYVSIPAEYRT